MADPTKTGTGKAPPKSEEEKTPIAEQTDEFGKATTATKDHTKAVEGQTAAQKGLADQLTETNTSLEANTQTVGAAARGALAWSKIAGAAALNAKKLKEGVKGITNSAIELQASLEDSNIGFRKLSGQLLNTDALVSRNAGGISDLTERYSQVQKATQYLGSTNTEVQQTYENLYKSSRTAGFLMTQNDESTKKQVDSLAELSIKLARVGTDSAEFANTLDLTSKTFGSTDIVGDTEQLALKMLLLRRATGETSETISSNFKDAMDIVVMHGREKGVKVFQELQVIASAAGVSMKSLTTAAGKFNEFDQAAESASSLNEILRGPYFTTLQLINMTESERIIKIREAVKKSVGSFGALDKYHKIALADRMGLAEHEAQRVVDMNDTVFAKMYAKMTQEGGKSLDEFLGTQSKMRDGAARNTVSAKQQHEALIESVTSVPKAGEVALRTMKKVVFETSKASKVLSDLLKGPVEDAMYRMAGIIEASGKLIIEGAPLDKVLGILMATMAKKAAVQSVTKDILDKAIDMMPISAAKRAIAKKALTGAAAFKAPEQALTKPILGKTPRELGEEQKAREGKTQTVVNVQVFIDGKDLPIKKVKVDEKAAKKTMKDMLDKNITPAPGPRR